MRCFKLRIYSRKCHVIKILMYLITDKLMLLIYVGNVCLQVPRENSRISNWAVGVVLYNTLNK